MKRKILFITWDGPQTSYMEGLFMPIFHEISKCEDVSFHVVQFTWADEKRIAITSEKALELGIQYTAHPIVRKPNATLGSLYSLFRGVKFIEKYIKTHAIDIVMPRSTMPSIMVNKIRKRNFVVLFDADGLALEERVDFSGLSRQSKQYLFFKKEEEKMLKNADGVITRSQKAIEIHLKTIGEEFRNKFTVVSNGRNIDFFKPNSEQRFKIRTGLHCSDEELLFVYCGSLGAQYGWDEMLAIFSQYQKQHENSKFLLLTGNPEFTEGKIPNALSDSIFVRKVPFEEVPNYLSAADVAFAIREPKFSMQGVAPIKLGEYLLMGLPTIASIGIGDSEAILKDAPNCLLFDHNNVQNIATAVSFVEHLKDVHREEIRSFGRNYFSIEKSAASYITSFNKLTDICFK